MEIPARPDRGRARRPGCRSPQDHRTIPKQAKQAVGQRLLSRFREAGATEIAPDILLPAGEPVGGVVDRDQWTTILHTVSAVTAYRWLYADGLTPANVIDLLLARAELPRSLAASSDEVVELLALLARKTGQHGEADAMARARALRVARTRSGDVILGDGDGVIVIPAAIADEVAAEAVEMTAYEDFATERVRAGQGLPGLYPATDPKNLEAFAAWRKEKGR